MTEAAPLAELAAMTERAWLVGGAVRDELLGRATEDFDVAVEGDARGLARRLGRVSDAHSFRLSEAYGAWRVIARDGTWQVDLTPLATESLEQDLARRDLTVNAIARSLRDGSLIDPFGGEADLRAGRLRMVTPVAFTEDPVRTIRLARLAADLGFEIEPATASRAAASAGALDQVPPERVFAELKLIVAGARPVAGLDEMTRLGVTEIVLPALAALRGIDQSDYHHLDAYDHTMDALEQVVALEHGPPEELGAVGEEVARFLAEPLANELSRGGALRFGALFHDMAKSATRAVNADGRVTFFGHDRAGAELARETLTGMRASERLATHVAALTRHHLRLGFLVHDMPLDRRAVYGYLKLCEPVEIDVTLLSVADRLATRGRNSERAIERHLQLAAEILPEAFRWHIQPPRPLVRGDRLARALGLRPGPEVGRLLEEVTVATFAGEVQTEDEAIAWARRSLGGSS